MGEVRQKCQRGVRSISAKFGHLHKIEQPIVMIVMMIIIASCQIDITMTMRQKSIEKIKRQLAEGLKGCKEAIFGERLCKKALSPQVGYSLHGRGFLP